MIDQRPSSQQKRVIAERARGCCEYCRSQEAYATQGFSVEHITPRQRGGQTLVDNLALARQGCNNHKHTKIEALDPIRSVVVLLYHPRRQRWDEHFAWDDSYTLIIGLTPTGRATVAALQLNRVGLVNLRRILYASGVHPPLTPY